MARDTDQPSITQRYAQTQAHGPHPDVGQSTSNQLAAMSLYDRARYAEPTYTTGPIESGLSREEMFLNNFNTRPSAPVKYAAPNALDEELAARQTIRDAIPASANKNVLRTDPITDTEVAAYRQKVNQAELAKFEDYVTAKYNMDRPGEFSWLMKIYPEYVMRRLEQQHTDFDYAVKSELIERYGVQTFDDLYFKYQIDQGYITGPKLARTEFYDDRYVPGLLSVFAFDPLPNQMQPTFLPGARDSLPGNEKDTARYALKNRPLQYGKEHIAHSMYNNGFRRGMPPPVAAPPQAEPMQA